MTQAEKDGRPQDYLGSMTVGTLEISNESHRDGGNADALAKLLKSGKTLLPPLVTRTPSGRLELLAGERRFEAAKAAGQTRIKVWAAHDIQGLLAWLELDRREPGGTMMKLSEVGRFSGKAVYQLRLNGRNVGQLDRVLAEMYEFSVQDVQYARQLVARWQRLPEGPDRDRFTQYIKEVDAGEIRPSSVLSRETLRDKRVSLARNAPPAAEQHKVLKRALPALRGTVEALNNIGPVSADVPAAYRAEALKVIRDSYIVLNRMARQLRELGEGTAS